jgi:WD40 repeat protein
LWDVRDGRAAGKFSEAGRDISDVQFSPDGRLLAWCDKTDGFVRVVELESEAEKACLPATGHFQFLPGGHTLVVTTYVDNKPQVGLWDFRMSQLRCRIEGRGGYPAISPDGTLLALGASYDREQATALPAVTLWDTVTGTLVKTLTGFRGWVHDLQFDRDGRWLFAECNVYANERMSGNAISHDVHVWDCQTWKEVAVIKDTDSPVLLPASDTLAVYRQYLPGPEGVHEFWDTATWKKRCECPVTPGLPLAARRPSQALSDGRSLLAFRWFQRPEDSDLQRLGQWLGHPDWGESVQCVEYRCLDSLTGRDQARFLIERAFYGELSPDGRTIAASTNVGKGIVIELWDAPPRRPVELYLLFSALPALLFTGLLWWRVR